MNIHIIKVGTSSFCRSTVEAIASAKHASESRRFEIVTSWAKWAWQLVLSRKWIDWISKAASCAIWQPLVMREYMRAFEQNWLCVWQVLLEDPYDETLCWKWLESIRTERNKHILSVLKDLHESNITPIINHNDVSTSAELEKVTSWTDNDRNVRYLVEEHIRANSLKLDKVTFLTDTAWILNSSNTTITSISWESLWMIEKYITEKTSGVSTWWMKSKLKNIQEICALFASVQDWISRRVRIASHADTYQALTWQNTGRFTDVLV